MQVFDFSPIKLSLSTWVNLLALKGKCVPFLPNARIHSFRASSDLLISAPSIPTKENEKKKKQKNTFHCKAMRTIIRKKKTYAFVYWPTKYRLLAHYRQDRWAKICHELCEWWAFVLLSERPREISRNLRLRSFVQTCVRNCRAEWVSIPRRKFLRLFPLDRRFEPGERKKKKKKRKLM